VDTQNCSSVEFESLLYKFTISVMHIISAGFSQQFSSYVYAHCICNTLGFVCGCPSRPSRLGVGLFLPHPSDCQMQGFYGILGSWKVLKCHVLSTTIFYYTNESWMLLPLIFLPRCM